MYLGAVSNSLVFILIGNPTQDWNYVFVLLQVPTDEEQATGLEKIIMKAMKEGAVCV